MNSLGNNLINNCLFLLKSSKEFISIVTSGKDQWIMVYTVRANAGHGRDIHPLADHMTELQHFTKGNIREFSAFPSSL